MRALLELLDGNLPSPGYFRHHRARAQSESRHCLRPFLRIECPVAFASLAAEFCGGDRLTRLAVADRTRWRASDAMRHRVDPGRRRGECIRPPAPRRRNGFPGSAPGNL